MTDTDPLQFVKENMKQEDFTFCVGANAAKGFISVLLILGAFVAFQFLSSLNDGFIWLSLAVAIPSFVALYIHISKVPTLSEFIITDKLDSEENNWFLIKAQLRAWTLAIGTDVVALIAITIISGVYDPLQMAIFKIIGISLITSSFFIYTKREDIWTESGFNSIRAWSYILLGFAFGTSTYLIGGIIIVASALIGWELTVTGIGLEVAFTSIYTYMDLQRWVREYKERQVRIAERKEAERIKRESEGTA